ncbi:MAG: N-formylglutamate amidohydrolase [Pirellulaceae bacterium]
MDSRLLITCEHGGADVPAKYARLFRGQRRLLDSHRGYDAGALEMARRFADQLAAPLIFSTTTRLLVDLNRSAHHRHVFSEFTSPLDREQRAALLAEHHAPYRQDVQKRIAGMTTVGVVVIHLSVHTFTPILNGARRTADVGLLYDSRRRPEAEFCGHWGGVLRRRRPDLRVRRNYPYLGKADGLTTALRKQYGEDRYLGVELEVCRAWWKPGNAAWRRLQHDLIEAFRETTHAAPGFASTATASTPTNAKRRIVDPTQ